MSRIPLQGLDILGDPTMKKRSVCRTEGVDVTARGLQDLDRINAMLHRPMFRKSKVVAVRQQIEADTYEDDDKLDVTVERLLDEILQ